MKTTLLVVVSIFFLGSCMSSTRLIQHTHSAYKEVNQKLRGEAVTVVKLDEEELKGKYVRVIPDSMTVGMETIAIENVKEIQIKNHSKGAFSGMGLGFLSGFLIGALIGAISSEDEQPNDNMEIVVVSEEAAIGVAGAFAGLVLGGVYGGISGVTDYYVFTQPDTTDTTDVFTFKKEVETFYRVEISSIVEETSEYIIIYRQDKQIRLLKAEYNSIVETEDGKQLIVVPEEVYLEKFK